MICVTVDCGNSACVHQCYAGQLWSQALLGWGERVYYGCDAGAEGWMVVVRKQKNGSGEEYDNWLPIIRLHDIGRRGEVIVLEGKQQCRPASRLCRWLEGGVVSCGGCGVLRVEAF